MHTGRRDGNLTAEDGVFVSEGIEAATEASSGERNIYVATVIGYKCGLCWILMSGLIMAQVALVQALFHALKQIDKPVRQKMGHVACSVLRSPRWQIPSNLRLSRCRRRQTTRQFASLRRNAPGADEAGVRGRLCITSAGHFL